MATRTVERGREQQHLTVAAGLLDDAANRGEEAHVGHLVGFVDHDGGDVTQVEGTHLEEVLQAAGTGDDDFDALVECTLLRAVADAAVDGDGRMAFGLGERGDLGHDLLGELTGRCEHERDGALRLGVGQAGHQRQTEAERLARSGRCAAGDVAAGESVGDHRSLDGERIAHSLALEALQDARGQAQLGKGDGRDARGVIDHGHFSYSLDFSSTAQRPEQRNSEMHSPVGGSTSVTPTLPPKVANMSRRVNLSRGVRHNATGRPRNTYTRWTIETSRFRNTWCNAVPTVRTSGRGVMPRSNTGSAVTFAQAPLNTLSASQ